MLQNLYKKAVIGLDKRDFQKSFVAKATFVTRGSYEVGTILKDDYKIEGTFKNDKVVMLTIYPLNNKFKNINILDLGLIFGKEWYSIISSRTTTFMITKETRNNRLIGMLWSRDPNDYCISFKEYGPLN